MSAKLTLADRYWASKLEDAVALGESSQLYELIARLRETECMVVAAERRGAERALRWAWDEIECGNPTNPADENRDSFVSEGLAALFPTTPEPS